MTSHKVQVKSHKVPVTSHKVLEGLKGLYLTDALIRENPLSGWIFFKRPKENLREGRNGLGGRGGGEVWGGCDWP